MRIEYDGPKSHKGLLGLDILKNTVLLWIWIRWSFVRPHFTVHNESGVTGDDK